MWPGRNKGLQQPPPREGKGVSGEPVDKLNDSKDREGGAGLLCRLAAQRAGSE